MKLPQIKPITQELLAQLKIVAEKDGHAMIVPTHVVLKESKIVGYLSIGAIPLVHVWMDREQTGVVDSIDIVGFINGKIDGLPGYFVVMTKDSPYQKTTEQFGLQKIANSIDLFVKAL